MTPQPEVSDHRGSMNPLLACFPSLAGKMVPEGNAYSCRFESLRVKKEFPGFEIQTSFATQYLKTCLHRQLIVYMDVHDPVPQWEGLFSRVHAFMFPHVQQRFSEPGHWTCSQMFGTPAWVLRLTYPGQGQERKSVELPRQRSGHTVEHKTPPGPSRTLFLAPLIQFVA